MATKGTCLKRLDDCRSTIQAPADPASEAIRCQSCHKSPHPKGSCWMSQVKKKKLNVLGFQVCQSFTSHRSASILPGASGGAESEESADWSEQFLRGFQCFSCALVLPRSDETNFDREWPFRIIFWETKWGNFSIWSKLSHLKGDQKSSFIKLNPICAKSFQVNISSFFFPTKCHSSTRSFQVLSIWVTLRHPQVAPFLGSSLCAHEAQGSRGWSTLSAEQAEKCSCW